MASFLGAGTGWRRRGPCLRRDSPACIFSLTLRTIPHRSHRRTATLFISAKRADKRYGSVGNSLPPLPSQTTVGTLAVIRTSSCTQKNIAKWSQLALQRPSTKSRYFLTEFVTLNGNGCSSTFVL